MKTVVPQKIANIVQIKTYSEIHQKLGHPGEEITKATANKIGMKISKKIEKCESCPIGKTQQKNLSKIAGRKSEKPGQVLLLISVQ